MKILYFLYFVSKAVRQVVVVSGFGMISACKHKPPCGEYLLQVVKKEGFRIGLPKGIKRMLACY